MYVMFAVFTVEFIETIHDYTELHRSLYELLCWLPGLSPQAYSTAKTTKNYKYSQLKIAKTEGKRQDSFIQESRESSW